MLSIRTFASGSASKMRRVATAPFILGSAKSITMTCGLSAIAATTASKPSLASPTTLIPVSSSSIRRKPFRTRLWSSTRSTLISVCGICLRSVIWCGCADKRAAHPSPQKFDGALHKVNPLAHRDQAQSMGHLLRISDSLILHLHHNDESSETKPNDCAAGFGMPNHIVERFLHNPIKMNGNLSIQIVVRAFFLVCDAHARALF